MQKLRRLQKAPAVSIVAALPVGHPNHPRSHWPLQRVVYGIFSHLFWDVKNLFWDKTNMEI